MQQTILKLYNRMLGVYCPNDKLDIFKMIYYTIVKQIS